MLVCGLQIIFLMCLTFLTFLLFPTSPFFITAVLPEQLYTGFSSFLALPLIYLFHVYIIIIYFAQMTVLVIGFMVYALFVIPFILREFRFGLSSYKSLGKLRTSPSVLINSYRGASLLHEHMLGLIELLLIPMESVARKFLMYAPCLIFRYGRKMTTETMCMVVFFSLAMFCGWTMVLVLGGFLNFHGLKLLDSWKYKRHQPWLSRYNGKVLSRFRKSCRPMAIRYGNMYVIRKITLVKFFRGISVGILRILILMKSRK